MDNRTIAFRLRQKAQDLEGQRANLFRVRAYRRAAATVAGLEQSVGAILASQGRTGLRAFPGIGAHLCYTIETLFRTGTFPEVGKNPRGAGDTTAPAPPDAQCFAVR